MSAPQVAWQNRLRRIAALIRKETRQIVRDPSTLIIAVILPMTLLFLFGYGVSFDARRIEIGLVIEEATPEAASFTTSLTSSPCSPRARRATGTGSKVILSPGASTASSCWQPDFRPRP